MAKTLKRSKFHRGSTRAIKFTTFQSKIESRKWYSIFLLPRIYGEEITKIKISKFPNSLTLCSGHSGWLRKGWTAIPFRFVWTASHPLPLQPPVRYVFPSIEEEKRKKTRAFSASRTAVLFKYACSSEFNSFRGDRFHISALKFSLTPPVHRSTSPIKRGVCRSLPRNPQTRLILFFLRRSRRRFQSYCVPQIFMSYVNTRSEWDWKRTLKRAGAFCESASKLFYQHQALLHFILAVEKFNFILNFI